MWHMLMHSFKSSYMSMLFRSTEAYKCQAALLSTRLTMAEIEQMRMGIYQAERREQKEALRLKEEQCYEKMGC